jgi:integrase
MINPKFHLQSPSSAIDGDFPLLMLFSVNGKRLQYYTGIRMPKKYHVKTGKYPFSNKWQEAPGVKIKLDALLRHVFSIETDLISEGITQTVDVFREQLDKRFKGREAEPVKVSSLDDRITEYLDHVKNNLAYNTFKNNQSGLNHFKTFLGKKATTMKVTEVDENTIEGFNDFLKAGRLNNTVVKAMQVLRTFLQYCLKKKYIASLPLLETGSPNNITVIHLSYDEVLKMAETTMPTPTLERVRDFFVFGCFTGMRYSDIAGLKKSNIYKDHIKFFIQKSGTTQTLTVPFTPMSKRIIEKYKDIPGEYALPSISNQKTNDYLKEVASIAGINSVVEIAHKTAAGRIEKVETTKDQLISCHTSRKSFITIAMTLGMPESVIVSITGHTKGSKAFHKYYDVVNSTKFDQMAKIFSI